MIVKSYQTAFHRGDGPVQIRRIDIPVAEIPHGESEGYTEKLLELAFYYGQNDFQPVQDRYSVSVGDVVELPGAQLYRCAGVGWVKLDPQTDPTALVGREARMADSL